VRNKRIDLVCDGGSDIGFGHIRRILALSDQLSRQGFDCNVIGISPHAASLLPRQPQSFSPASIVVFDAPNGLEERMKAALAIGQCVVALDWFGRVEPDIAITVYPHSPVRARYRSYVGLEYQIIRSEITDQPTLKKGKDVVVMLGGGDLLKQGHLVSEQLSQKGLKVVLIQGPFADKGYNKAGYEVVFDPTDLPSRLMSASWLVTNGGACMFEAMCLGKAAAVLPQTPAEAVLADIIYSDGGVLSVGLQHLTIPSDAEVLAVEHQAARLVDGRGVERVAQIIGELV
jgi:spore coat polysaccharide biosynthesis predicted glycosyltransferase SpsG